MTRVREKAEPREKPSICVREDGILQRYPSGSSEKKWELLKKNRPGRDSVKEDIEILQRGEGYKNQGGSSRLKFWRPRGSFASGQSETSVSLFGQAIRQREETSLRLS
ncbi:hypothetical protein KM043_011998 [Ampulex compressa]|nr:hypothetical protein KM043_011998 [Ampulex compressa]